MLIYVSWLIYFTISSVGWKILNSDHFQLSILATYFVEDKQMYFSFDYWNLPGDNDSELMLCKGWSEFKTLSIIKQEYTKLETKSTASKHI